MRENFQSMSQYRIYFYFLLKLSYPPDDDFITTSIYMATKITT